MGKNFQRFTCISGTYTHISKVKYIFCYFLSFEFLISSIDFSFMVDEDLCSETTCFQLNSQVLTVFLFWPYDYDILVKWNNQVFISLWIISLWICKIVVNEQNIIIHYNYIVFLNVELKIFSFGLFSSLCTHYWLSTSSLTYYKIPLSCLEAMICC